MPVLLGVLKTSGNDTIRFAAGNIDTVDGGSGVDTLRANAASATIVWSNVTNVEVLDGTGFTGVAALGTASANVLDFSGVSLVNVARIDGLGGNDTITGSAGNDVVVGGAGKDLLTGGGGADTFDFNLVSESTLASFDEVLDFLQGTDRLDFLTIDASTATTGNQDFAFIGSGSFTGTAGQLRYDLGMAGVTRILADTNGDSVADMEVRLVGSHALTAADFIGVV